MHYTGINSVSLICTAQAPAGTWLFGTSYLDLIVFSTAALVLVSIYWAVSGRSVRQQKAAAAARRAGMPRAVSPR
jgi:uncharacterized membrane protein